MTPLLLALLTGCKIGEPGEAPARRLTPTQYNNTVRDLLGHTTADDWPEPEELETEGMGAQGAWPWNFPADIAVNGFEGIAEGQIASAYLIEQYQAAASHFSAYALHAPHYWTCEGISSLEDDAATRCAQDSILRFTSRAYRRPMTDEEQTRLLAFHTANVSEWGVLDGTRLSVQGVLMTPQFLYRLESAVSRDRPEALSDFEMASRLSYFLWDSMPDPALFEAAAGGKLSSTRQIEAESERMLADDKAREAVVHFHRQWLGFDEVYTANADMDTYQPQYLPDAWDMIDQEEELFVEEIEEVWSSYLIGARAGMVLEAELFVEKTIFDGGGSLYWLMTDNHGYVTTISSEETGEEQSTDRIYGITDADRLSGEVVSVSMDDGNLSYELLLTPAVFPAEQRAGVLTQPAVLAGLSHPVHPAPILRGVFIQERMLCQIIGQPPDGAETAAPADSLDVESTNRDRTEQATSPAECTGCHSMINPLGFAFESFDSMGGWRDIDNDLPVDASGTLDITGEGFSSAAELAGHLAVSRELHDCYTLLWTRYALGQSDPNAATLTALQEGFYSGDGDITELLIDITTSDAFRYRSGGAQ